VNATAYRTKNITIFGKELIDEKSIRQIEKCITSEQDNEPVEYKVLDNIHKAEFVPQRKLFNLAKDQLGTVGSAQIGGLYYISLVYEDIMEYVKRTKN